jgi:hypothetical protein
MILNTEFRTYRKPCDRKWSNNLPTAHNYYRSDFHTFWSLKKAIKCCTFISDGSVQWFRQQPKDFFDDGRH